MEDCLLSGDSNHLVSVLRYEGLTSATLNRLDQLVTKDLSRCGFNRVLVVLKSFDLLLESREDLQTLVHHGLTSKVLLWFKAIRDLLTSDLHKNSTPLLSLTEEFYHFLLVLSQSCLPVSQLSVVLLQMAQMTLESEIHFPLRLEAIRTFNSILQSLNPEERKLIQSDQNQNQILSEVAAAVLTVGDYELQVSLSEALCRLTPKKSRQQRASQWFSSSDISSAFCDIRDGDFEVDCRHFLNFVNRFHGNQRRIYTFPCLRAFLDSTQLFKPKDEKLDEFWIDFNVGSGCVSFFVDEPGGFLWGSIHLLKEDVGHYSLWVKHNEGSETEMVLSIQLNNPIMHHNSRGRTVELCFSRELQGELEEAVGRVFMREKSSPSVKDKGSTVQRNGGRSYSRKKPQKKSQLKVLPLSSASSEEVDSVALRPPGRSRAEVLFEQIKCSTATYQSGVLVGTDSEILEEHNEELGGRSSPLQKVFSDDRKRAATDSGYLSRQSEGSEARKRRVDPQLGGAESNSVVTVWSPEEAEPPAEEGLFEEEGVSSVKSEGPMNVGGAERETSLTSGITAAFKSFITQLEQQFTGCWQKVENEVLQSLKECQQQVSTLVTAVHQHRCLLLQKFENVTDQLNQLDENSNKLDTMNIQILGFLQSEIQRLGSFCDECLQRLKCLENEANEGGGKIASNQEET